MHFEHILIPTDFSDHSKLAFELAALQAKMEGTRLTLLHIVENPIAVNPFYGEAFPVGYEEVRVEAQEASTKRVQELATKYFHGQNVQAKAMPVKSSIGRDIVEVALQENCDLIVMASQGWGALASLVLGSVTQRVISLARCPVLVVPTPKSK